MLRFQFIERLLESIELVFQEGLLTCKPLDVVPCVLLRLGYEFFELRAPALELLHFLGELFLVGDVQVHVFQHLLNLRFEFRFLLLQVFNFCLLCRQKVVINRINVKFDDQEILYGLLVLVFLELRSRRLIKLLVFIALILA